MIVSHASRNSVSAPVYRVLIADLPAGDVAALPAAQAVIWRAIDSLRAMEGEAGQIAVLEDVSRELHALRQKGREPSHLVRARLAALTRDWLQRAPLLG